MNPFKVKVTASLAGVIFASSSLMVVGAKATQVGGVDTDFLSSEFAKADHVIGSVGKSLPVDQNRASYGEFLPVKNSDKLPEGALVKTGRSSYVALTWMSDNREMGITRLWDNSIATVSTKTKIVHLQQGGLSHEKGRDKNDHIIETKLLQARIHGTTVRVWTGFEGDKEVDRILVLETNNPRPVEVLNRSNGSRLMLRPGIVLEVRALISSAPNTIPVAATPSSKSNICLKPDKGELIFQDNKTQTIAYVANSKAVFEDPLIKGGNGLPPISSIGLIQRDMAKVPSSDDLLGNFVEAAINIGKPDKLISKNVEISSPPTKTKYYVGPNVGEGRSIDLPTTYISCQPSGRIAEPERHHVASTSAINSQHATMSVIPVPIETIPAGEPPKPIDPQELITADNLQIDAHHGKAN